MTTSRAIVIDIDTDIGNGLFRFIQELIEKFPEIIKDITYIGV